MSVCQNEKEAHGKMADAIYLLLTLAMYLIIHILIIYGIFKQ